MRTRLLLVLLLLFGIGLIQPVASYAEPTDEQAAPKADEPVIPKPLKVMPSKIKPVQSTSDELSKAAPEPDNATASTDTEALESLSPRPTSGFQGDFWNGISREELAAFLATPSIATSLPSVRNLALKATLTPTPSLSESKNQDENIYALRLQKLVALGSFDDAQKLYKLNEADPPTALAAQTGIESSVGSGEIAVACLDQKTFNESLKNKTTSFWDHIDTFCQALLGPVAGNDDVLRLANASRAYIEIVKPSAPQVDSINQLDVITTIAMAETGGLSTYTNSPVNLKKIDDKHLAVILTHTKPSYNSLPLLAEGLRRGMSDYSKAIDFLKTVDLKDTSNDYYAFLKEYFKSGTPVVSDQLLSLANSDVKKALLLPLYAADETAIPATHKELSAQLLLLTNQDVAPNLIKEAFSAPDIPVESSVNNSESGTEILIKTLLEQSNKLHNQQPNYRSAALAALDYANYPQKDTKNAYENILSLTPEGNYVMPIGDILSSLKKSADKKQMNQVVIRSLSIINDKPLEQLHPAALYRILEALNSAGLNEETMSLTHDALGYLMNTK